MISLTEHSIYNSENKSWATCRLCLGYLSSILNCQELSIFQNDRDGGKSSIMGGWGTSFKSNIIFGVCFKAGTSAEKTQPLPETK